MLALAGSFAAGVLLAVALLLGPASGGSEPLVTGSVLIAFGLGWGLMAVLTTRFSGQAQTWMAVPAAFLGLIGLGLIVFQPSARGHGPAELGLAARAGRPGHLDGRAGPARAPRSRSVARPPEWSPRSWSSPSVARSRPSVGPRVPALRRRPAGWSTSAAITCTSNAPARGLPPSSSRLALASRRPPGAGSRRTVAASTTVCTYDRAGHGRSDEAAAPQDGNALATDLHTLLERAGVAGPYVLVGHSSGGAYVRVFADRYPDQVAGMVLLDSQPADAFTALPDYPTTYRILRTVYSLSQPLARIGVLGPILGLPADQSTPAAARAARDEIVALPAALEQSLAFPGLGDRPLIVVTAGSGQQTGWLEAQDRLSGLSTNSSHRVLDAATHTSLITGADASASIQGDPRRRVVAQDRDGRPMSAPSGSLFTQVDRPIPAFTAGGRLARAVVATLVIGGYMALGFAFGLSAEGYLLLGIPITIGFQVLVARRPLRALWLRDAPPMTFTPRTIVAIAVVAIAPAIVAVGGVRTGDPIPGRVRRRGPARRRGRGLHPASDGP